MRVIAFLASLVALAGLGFAGQKLQIAWVSEPQVVTTESSGQPQRVAELQRPSSPQFREWPAIFGERVIPEPQPPAPPNPPEPPEPPPPAAPPVESLGYSLKGTVELGGSSWAIVSHPTGDQVLSVGDELVAGVIVVEITEEGLGLETARGREFIGFGE